MRAAEKQHEKVVELQTGAELAPMEFLRKLEALSKNDKPSTEPKNRCEWFFGDESKLDARFKRLRVKFFNSPKYRKQMLQRYATLNARIENIASSAAFKDGLKHRRGIALMSGFVEWQTEVQVIETGVTKAGKIKTKTNKIKHPFYAECIDQPLIVGGIWENWRDQVWSFAVVTQQADEAFSAYHSRMPLSLTVGQAKRWLDSTNNPTDLLKEREGKSLPLKVRAVSQEINNARNKVDVEYID